MVGIIRDDPGPLLTLDQQRLLDALADQAALAIERVNLARDLHLTRLQVETDRLRSALLTSISHDLRTPPGIDPRLRHQPALAGRRPRPADQASPARHHHRGVRPAEPLHRQSAGHDEAGIRRLEAAYRLERLVRCDRVRLAAGIEDPDRPPHQGRPPANLPLLALDMVLFEQVLFNLLDNAAKHAPAGSLISIQASHDSDTVTLRIMDEGDGVPAGDLDRIFEKFYRAGGGDRKRAGTGLGLAICRGFVEAMDGRISARNRTDRQGAVFLVTLPVPINALLPEVEATTP